MSTRNLGSKACIVLAFALLLVATATVAEEKPTPTPTPTNTLMPTPTHTRTPTPTRTPTNTSTPTATGTPIPSELDTAADTTLAEAEPDEARPPGIADGADADILARRGGLLARAEGQSIRANEHIDMGTVREAPVGEVATG